MIGLKVAELTASGPAPRGGPSGLSSPEGTLTTGVMAGRQRCGVNCEVRTLGDSGPGQNQEETWWCASALSPIRDAGWC